MPRSSKRKAAPPAPVTSDVDYVRPAPGKAAAKKLVKIDLLFDSYANQSLGIIDPDGIAALCKDMRVDHTDVRILMLAWKLKAEKQGYFTLAEWRRGLKDLQADSLNKLKKSLPELVKEVKTPPNFEDFYCYAYRYCLTEEKQRSVDIETICELLNLVLRSEFCPQVDLITKFLKIQSEYKVLNMDQWINLYRFCNEISFPDLRNYDSEQAWPVILDNFVEWMRGKEG